jgi:hypothetical protein
MEMDAILFSAKPSVVDMDDVIRHLEDHEELYFEVKFAIDKSKYRFPLLGLVHISGDQVRYCVKISDIIAFSPTHYQNATLAERVKPQRWILEWKANLDNCQHWNWRCALVMTHIEEYSYNTWTLQKFEGGLVRQPPQQYIKIVPPLGVPFI